MRYYESEGILYPSVTTALSVIRKPFIERWRGDVGNKQADTALYEAGDLGTDIHTACDAINRGEQPHGIYSNQMEQMVTAYADWFNENVSCGVCCEHPVINKTYRYAGRLDLFAVLKGDELPSVIDIKTGGYTEAALQLAAYQKPLEEQGWEISRRVVVHIDKKTPGKLTVKEFTAEDYSRDFRTFLYALELFRYFNPSPKPSEIVKLEGGIKNDAVSA